MTAKAKQKGRLETLHVRCTECSRLYATRLRLVSGYGSGDVNDERIVEHLTRLGWSGQWHFRGGEKVCHSCNKRPPTTKLRPVDPANEATWEPWK